MINNKKLTFITVCVVIGIFATSVYAVRLLSKKIALKKMMPEAENIVEETRKISPEEKSKILKNLGGVMVFYQPGSESEKVYERNEYTFCFGMRGGKKTWVAIIEKQPGKWGPVEYIICLDATTAKVKDLAVMSYTERRGRPIARRNFLKQFIGKHNKDPIKVRKDIRSITGATISCVATCFAIKKISILYEVLYLTEGK
jgi:Na+-translocating ferredoxin:NAD+ oxidoreductase RnfG subunit